MTRYFFITCSRGHCGTGKSSEIGFSFAAPNLLAAMDMAKRMPSVKHSRGILYGREISFEAYTEYRTVSAYERVNIGTYKAKKVRR